MYGCTGYAQIMRREIGAISMQLRRLGIPMLKSAYVSWSVGFSAWVLSRIQNKIYMD